MPTRSHAREVAFQMLHQADVNSDIHADTVRQMIEDRIRLAALQEFAWELFGGVIESRKVLDAKIESIAENWSVSRMSVTDRNVIRLGAFELLYTQTPRQVVIDQAIELARKFGIDQSPQFVNGVLDQIGTEQDPDSGD